MRKRTIAQRLTWILRELDNTVNADMSTTIRNRVKLFQQWTSYSCTAAVLQMVLHHVSGKSLNHFEAIKLMGCKPDGGYLTDIPIVIRSLGYKIAANNISEVNKLKHALSHGYVVISMDACSHANDHAILVTGYNADGYWLVDPILAIPTFRPKEEFLRDTGEWIAVKKKVSK